jgi:hypothetical protein
MMLPRNKYKQFVSILKRLHALKKSIAVEATVGSAACARLVIIKANYTINY